MTMVPPSLSPIDLSGYPSAYRDYPSVQPFSQRSALTYQQKLEAIAAWIPRILVPWIADNYQALDNVWIDQVNELAGTVQTALDAQRTEVETALTTQQQTVADNLAATLAGIVSGESAALNDAAVKAALQVANSTALAFLDGRYVQPSGIAGQVDGRYRRTIIVPVGVDTTVDSTAAIQAALDAGADVEIVGPFNTTNPGQAVISATLRTNATVPYQALSTRHAQIVPNFRGDAVLMTTAARIAVDIRGALQPATGDYSAVAAIRIGSVASGYNPQHGSVAYSNVQNWKGDAVVWEAGSMIDFTHFHADTVSGTGINCIAVGNDNNHGFFANTHIVKAAGKGYGLYGDGSNLSQGGSRHHIFSDAKAFQCGQNYYIESRSNGGRIFSELGTIADTTTATSRGNDFDIHETAASFEGWVDNGQGNRISGYSNNNTWETKNSLNRNLVAEALLQFPGGKQIDNAKSAPFTIPTTAALTAGAFATFILEPGAWTNTLPAFGTLYGPDPTKFALAFSVGTSGALQVTVRNIDTSTHDVSGYQIRYLAFHVAN